MSSKPKLMKFSKSQLRQLRVALAQTSVASPATPAKKKKSRRAIRAQPMHGPATKADANLQKWLSLVRDPMQAPTVGVVPPYGHFNEAWWVTRRCMLETTVKVPAGLSYYFGVGLGSLCPLTFRRTEAFPVLFPNLLYSATAGDTTSLGNATATNASLQSTYQTWYDQLFQQCSVPDSLQGAAGQQMYAPTYADGTPLPLCIPLIAYISLKCTTPYTTTAGTMYGDVVTPQVYNVTSQDDTTIALTYALAPQHLQQAKHKADVIPGAEVSSIALCDETVFSNAVPLGMSNSLSGSSRGLAWTCIQNASASDQTFTLRASYIYMMEPLATSGLFDLAVRPQEIIESAHPAVSITQAVSAVHDVTTEARKEAEHVAGFGKAVLSGDVLGAVQQGYKVGASARELAKMGKAAGAVMQWRKKI